MTIGVQAYRDACIILSPSMSLADDKSGNKGIPKVGKVFDVMRAGILIYS